MALDAAVLPACALVVLIPASAADLAAGTIYRLRVADGAIKQALDGSGNPSASGVLFPLQGFESLFKTA